MDELAAPIGRPCWVAILGWQVVAALDCGVGVIATLIDNRCAATLPFLFTGMAYFLLILTSVWWCKRVEVALWRFAIVAVFALIADFCMAGSYARTNMATAMLMINTTVIWCGIFSYFVFRRRLVVGQVVGIGVGLVGIVLVWIADRTGGGDNNWVGNILGLAAGICYSISDVAQESVIKEDMSKTSYMIRFALIAFGGAAVGSPATEWRSIGSFPWDGMTGVLIVAYAVALACFYWGISIVMPWSDATTMNMSLLSVDFYGLVISIAAFGQHVSWLYGVGFCCVPAGIAVYTLTGPERCGRSKELVGYAPIGTTEGLPGEGGTEPEGGKVSSASTALMPPPPGVMPAASGVMSAPTGLLAGSPGVLAARSWVVAAPPGVMTSGSRTGGKFLRFAG